MASQLPATAPTNVKEAFAHINAVIDPTIDDLKMMVFLEASGLTAYEELAKTTSVAAVSDLLRANGREELAHAHRVSKVIERLTGEAFPPPTLPTTPTPNRRGAALIGSFWRLWSLLKTTATISTRFGRVTRLMRRPQRCCAKTALKKCVTVKEPPKR